MKFQNTKHQFHLIGTDLKNVGKDTASLVKHTIQLPCAVHKDLSLKKLHAQYGYAVIHNDTERAAELKKQIDARTPAQENLTPSVNNSTEKGGDQ